VGYGTFSDATGNGSGPLYMEDIIF
jgi:hypothetical protein